MKKGILIIAAVPFLAFALASCGNKNLKKSANGKTDMTTDITPAPGLDIQESTTTSEASVRGGNFVPQENIATIHFDYDSAELSDAVRQTLTKNAAVIKTHKDWVVMVEGHCDQRGTIEYNLALGQKRAQQARDYYIRLGVPKTSLGTISYGKEQPACEEENENCWATNRRAETKVKGNTP